MAKTVVHVGIAVSTDGLLPSRSNIINLAAAIGDRTFNRNVIPESGQRNESEFWKKHPEEFKELLKEPRTLKDVVDEFRGWLGNWQGNLIACTSSVDFWHLAEAMLKYTKKFPFGPLPLDTNSFYAAMKGTKTPSKINGSVVPVEIAKERWKMITGGVMPKIEVKTPKLKKPIPGAGARQGARVDWAAVNEYRIPNPVRQPVAYNVEAGRYEGLNAQGEAQAAPPLQDEGLIARLIRQQQENLNQQMRMRNEQQAQRDREAIRQYEYFPPIEPPPDREVDF